MIFTPGFISEDEAGDRPLGWGDIWRKTRPQSSQRWETWPPSRHEIGRAARGRDGRKCCRSGMPIKAGREALQATKY
jgi:hypothetical protein